MPDVKTASVIDQDLDFLPINGTDYVEFYVGNAKQSSHYYRSSFGFTLVAYCGPETGVRDRAAGFRKTFSRRRGPGDPGAGTQKTDFDHLCRV